MKRALLLLPLVVYLLLPTREFYWDGVSFAFDIERAQGNLGLLIHPNHLIYGLTGYLLHQIFPVRALFLLQAFNSVLAGLCVVLVYWINGRSSISLALLFAFSATWWKFATDANAYIPSIFFLVICYWLLLPGKKPRPFAVAVLHTVAMLFHQLAVLFFPVALAALWRQTRKVSDLVRYSVTAVLLTGGIYVYAYPGSGGFFRWITRHAPDSAFSFDVVRNAAISLRGTLRLFLGGKFTLIRFDVVTVAGIVLLAVTIGLLVWRVRELGWSGTSGEWRPLALWIACYFLFLWFWLPQNTFYRLFYLPPIIFLLGAAGLRGRAPLALPAAALFLWNFTFFIYPHSRVENNPPLQFALQRQADWPPGTTIAMRDFHSDLWTIRYFNPQTSWIDATSLADVEAHRPLWLEGSAYDLLKKEPRGERWLASHVDMSRSLITRSSTHFIRFYRLR